MGMSLPCVLEYFLHLARGCRSTLPAWLSIPNLASPDGSLADALQGQGKAIIEAALAECKGRIAGKNGAAAKLGIAPSTLESKVKRLNIAKDRFASS